MNELYPLKFAPVYKEKVWGGERLRDLFGKDFSPLPNCGESWELSGVPGSESKISNGFLAGNTLPELAEVYMADLVGERVFQQSGTDFPLLVKWIDTSSDLSLQVHPGDSMARARHNSRGKAEMWYVVSASPGAELLTGFNREVTRGEFLAHLENKSLREIVAAEKVSPGDVFYVPPGQIHAIGGGVTLCEIQQSSDITYRIHDWDRLDDRGNPRKLHLEEALDALDFGAPSGKVSYRESDNAPAELVVSPFFTTRMLCFDKRIELDYLFVDSFVIYVCLEGTCTVGCRGGEETLTAGETMLLPAEINAIFLTPSAGCRLLETYVL